MYPPPHHHHHHCGVCGENEFDTQFYRNQVWVIVSVFGYLSVLGRGLPDDTERMEPKTLWQEAGLSDRSGLNRSPSVEPPPPLWFMVSRKLRASEGVKEKEDKERREWTDFDFIQSSRKKKTTADVLQLEALTSILCYNSAGNCYWCWP